MLVGKLQSRPLCWHNTCCTHNSYKNVAVESSVMPSPWNLLAFSSKSVSNIFWKRICFLFVWPLKIQCIFKDTKVLQTFTPQRWSMASENGIIKKKIDLWCHNITTVTNETAVKEWQRTFAFHFFLQPKSFWTLGINAA